MKVFNISYRNSENSQVFHVGYFTTIIGVRARREQELDTLLGINYSKECLFRFLQYNRIK